VLLSANSLSFREVVFDEILNLMAVTRDRTSCNRNASGASIDCWNISTMCWFGVEIPAVWA